MLNVDSMVEGDSRINPCKLVRFAMSTCTAYDDQTSLPCASHQRCQLTADRGAAPKIPESARMGFNVGSELCDK